jgi:hypothetical protein
VGTGVLARPAELGSLEPTDRRYIYDFPRRNQKHIVAPSAEKYGTFPKEVNFKLSRLKCSVESFQV